MAGTANLVGGQHGSLTSTFESATTSRTPYSGDDVLELAMNEDAWQGDAMFTVSVDGVQQGGVQTVTALRDQGSTQGFDVMLPGLSIGKHLVTVDFLNDAYGGTPDTDRNLYVTGATLDGQAIDGSQLSEYSTGRQSFSFGDAVEAAPAPLPTMVGSSSQGGDVLVLTLTEDAWEGDANFTVLVDGVQQGGVQTVTALRYEGSTQAFELVVPGLSSGQHIVTVDFLNDAYGGTSDTDRNLFVVGATLNGQAIDGSQLSEYGSGPQSFAFNGTAKAALTEAPISIGEPTQGVDVLAMTVNEDYWQGNAMFTVSVDGVQQGAVQTVTAVRDEGLTQTFSLSLAGLTVGTHVVTVNFLNDTYDGTPDTDRNLFVTGATLDGQTVQSGQLAEYSSGPQSFLIGPQSGLAQVLTSADYTSSGACTFAEAADGSSIVLLGNGSQVDVAASGQASIVSGQPGSTQLSAVQVPAGSPPTIDNGALWSMVPVIPLSGSGQAGTTVAVLDTTSTMTSLLGYAVVGAGGTWSLNTPANLSPGSNSLVAIGVGGDSGATAASIPRDVDFSPGNPTAPSLTSVSSAAASSDDTSVITGKGEPGTTVELGQQTASGMTVIAQASVGADGTWTATIPVMSLGFGADAIYGCATTLAGMATPWSQLTTIDVQDPAASAIHVGSDLQAALRLDAADGLDATADLQKLANEASGTQPTALDIPTGTYLTSSTVFLKSGTILDDPGVTLKAAANWHLSTDPATDGTIRYAMLANADFGSTQVRDNGIEVRGLNFDWSGINSPGSAALRLVNVDNAFVSNCSFNGSEDGTAFMGVHGGVITNSTAINTTNYGFDNWGGPIDTVIRNNVVHAASFGGISITGELNDTSVTPGSNDAVIDNEVDGFSAYGIDVNTLNAASTLSGVLVEGNVVDGPGRGIEVVGSVSNATVDSNSIIGTFGQSALFVATSQYVAGEDAEPTNVWLLRNDIQNDLTSDASIAAIRLQSVGGGAIGNVLQDTTAPAGLWLAGSGLLADGNTAVNSPNGGLVSQIFGTDNVVGQLPALSGSVGPGAASEVSTSSPSSTPFDVGYGSYSPGTSLVSDAISPLTGTLSDQLSAVLVTNALSQISFQGGDHTVYMTQAASGAAIDGGSGDTQIVLLGGASPDYVMSPDQTSVTSLKLLDTYPAITNVTTNSDAGLQVWTGETGKTITVGGPDQTIHPGVGQDMLIGYAGGATTFAGTTQALNGDTIMGLDHIDLIDVTDMLPSAQLNVYDAGGGYSDLQATDGFVSLEVVLKGSYTTADFSQQADHGHGVMFQLKDAPPNYS